MVAELLTQFVATTVGRWVNRLTETLTSDPHTHVRPKKLRAPMGGNRTAAQLIHDERIGAHIWMFGGAGAV
jgi:hypothetical protein